MEKFFCYGKKGLCHRDGWCEATKDLPPCEFFKGKGGRKVKINTRADKIRYMSDEELAKLLCEGHVEAVCPDGCEKCDGDCEGHMLKWLQQPAE